MESITTSSCHHVTTERDSGECRPCPTPNNPQLDPRFNGRGISYRARRPHVYFHPSVKSEPRAAAALACDTERFRTKSNSWRRLKSCTGEKSATFSSGASWNFRRIKLYFLAKLKSQFYESKAARFEKIMTKKYVGIIQGGGKKSCPLKIFRGFLENSQCFEKRPIEK